MKHALLILVTFLCAANLEAQRDQTPINKSPHKFIFGLDGRKSFISSQHVNIVGVRVGIQHYDKYRVGIGYYFLTNTNRSGIFPNPLPSAAQKTNVNFKFNYFAGFFEYIIFRSKRWEFYTPLILGVGNIQQKISDDSNPLFNDSQKRTVMLIEPSIMATFKIFKWLGLGAGVGERTMLFSNEIIRKNFNSPIYIAKIRIFYGEIVKEGREKLK